MTEETANLLRQAALWAVPVLVAIVFHEVAHGWVADRLGDPTARKMGRLTLNPLPHVDIFGTVVLPALLLLTRSPFLFGWAKPVPVNIARLGNPKRDMVLVALAGPATNLLLAVGSAISLLHLLPMVSRFAPASVSVSVVVPLQAMAARGVLINVVLAVFNALPIPPLDGGRVLTGLLPMPGARLLARMEPFGIVLVVVLMVTRSLGPVVGYPIGLLLAALGTPFRLLVGYM